MLIDRELVPQHGLLRAVTKPARMPDRSVVAAEQADDDLHEGALAGAVLADKPDELAVADHQLDAREALDCSPPGWHAARPCGHAVAIAGVSGSWWAGAILGFFYVFGLVSPLLLSALGISRLRGRLRNPSLTLRLATRTIKTTVSRLVGGISFIALGSLMIVLALTGNARSAPGAQKAFGRWLTARANDIATAVPSAAGWALALALTAAVGYAGVRALRRPHRSRTALAAVGPRPPCCDSHDSDPEE
jgi:cytochrome c biogenesis protein CcdA